MCRFDRLRFKSDFQRTEKTAMDDILFFELGQRYVGQFLALIVIIYHLGFLRHDLFAIMQDNTLLAYSFYDKL
jgi:hypothetical protein